MKNMTIAKLHRWARKLVGFLAAIGVVIAYALSFLTVIAGVVIYAAQIWPGDYLALGVAGIIGALLSVLVERLTLVQAAKTRVSGEKKALIDAAFDAIEDKTPDVQARYRLEVKRVAPGAAGLLMVVGVIVSTCAGTLFWHYLLGRLPVVEAWGFSTLFSALVSFTLVESELHKEMQSEVVSDAIGADHFVKQAGLRDAEDGILNTFNRQHTAALGNALNNDTMQAIADSTALDTVDDLFGGSGRIPERVSAERDRKEQETRDQAEGTRAQMRQINDALEARGSRGKIMPMNDSPNRTRRLTQKLDGDTDEIINPFRQRAQ